MGTMEARKWASFHMLFGLRAAQCKLQYLPVLNLFEVWSLSTRPHMLNMLWVGPR